MRYFGGNRKLWDGDIEVTAIEIDLNIAKIYQSFFPKDKVIVTDAHKYLLKYYKEFDFIWSSPPCPSHSIIRKNCGVERKDFVNAKVLFPDMKLYEEIIFLQHYFKGKYIVENVVSYYEPLIKPQEIQRHYLWANFKIDELGKINELGGDNIARGKIKDWEKRFGFDLSKHSGVEKKIVLRNCVHPKLGLHIFNCAFKKKQILLTNLDNLEKGEY